MIVPKEITPEEAYIKLRDYQQNAVTACITYIKSFKKEEGKSMLVAMPTGSGKTAVMAVLSRCLNRNLDIVLVVSPRKAISQQLQKEIGNVFFSEKLEITDTLQRESVYYRSSSQIVEAVSIVLVTTIQQLDVLNRSKKPNFIKKFEALKKRVSLVLFDEGHYEPAKSWSSTIRDFNCPRIIFTATPFRNDHKGFDIDWKKAFSVKYNDILNQAYLRKVLFQEENTPKSAEDFIKFTMGKYKNNFGELDGINAKVIINCDSYKTIEKLTEILKSEKLPFIAIHERFSDKYVENPEANTISQHKIKSVPRNPEKMNEAIWIHQFKLLEGVDDPSFKMLSVYKPFSSTRALVQQVGRIIRNPQKSTDLAYVYDFSGGKFKKEWQNYLLYDKDNDIRNELNQNIFEKLDSSLNKLTYQYKKLREKFEGDEFKLWDAKNVSKNIRLPLKVNLVQRLDSFNLESLSETIDSMLYSEDKIYYKNKIDDETYLYYYFSITNSEFLTENYFPSIVQDILIVRDLKDFIAFFDSSGRSFAGLETVGIGMPLSPSLLSKIFREDEKTKFYRINLKNANLGTGDLRSHSFSSPSLARSTPFLNDFSHFMSSTFGSYIGEKEYLKNDVNKSKKVDAVHINTYVGFSRGRLSQHSSEYVSLNNYINWLEMIKGIMKEKDRKASNFFTRYAEEITILTSKDYIPTNILIDLAELNEEIIGWENSEMHQLSEFIPDACLSVKDSNVDGKQKYSFELSIDNDVFTIYIEYNINSKKYILDGNVQSNKIVDKQSKDFVDILAVLVKKQCFRILTETRHLYANGHFYKPSLKFGAEFNRSRFQLDGILYPIEELGKISSEKGTTSQVNNVGWDRGSLFNFIDQRGIDSSGADTDFTKLLGNPNLLLCTDLNTEVADFVAVTGSKMIFMHVKGNGNNLTKTASKYGATPISEVCNQAIKNLHYLSAFDTAKPKNILTFTGPHVVNNTKNNIQINVASRLRLNFPNKNITADEIWDIVEKVKFDGAGEREVWLVLGRVFSKAAFLSELAKAKPAAEAVQAAILLQNTMASINSMGVKLRVFCSE